MLLLLDGCATRTDGVGTLETGTDSADATAMRAVRVLIWTCVLLLALAACVVGMLGSIGAALCDSGDCPSDTAAANYARMFWAGAGTFVFVTVWLIARALRRRRRNIRR
jgi:hypothetical protein